MSDRSISFYWVDVFASRPLTGNPLALVPDADDLDESQMHAIAREFNQSETTFLLRPRLPGATCRLRSFTPAGAEVGGAGHNALGAWLWLAASGRLPDPSTPSPAASPCSSPPARRPTASPPSSSRVARSDAPAGSR